MYKVKMYEDNAGGISAVVQYYDELVNYIYGFQFIEHPNVSDLLNSARDGFEYADPFDPDNFSGMTLAECAAWAEAECDLIAEISDKEITLYPKAMGDAGRYLFGLVY